MDSDTLSLPSIVYTSDDSTDIVHSDDSADVGQSDDSADAVQSDDSADPGVSDEVFDIGEATYICNEVHSFPDDEARMCLLETGVSQLSSPFNLLSPGGVLMMPSMHCAEVGDLSRTLESSPTLSAAVVAESDATSQTTEYSSDQQMYLPSTKPSDDDSNSCSSSSGSQEALGLLHSHLQYAPFIDEQVSQQGLHTSVHYTHLDSGVTTNIRCELLDPPPLLTTKLDSLVSVTTNIAEQCPLDGNAVYKTCPGRWLVSNINIDARYKDAFYVKWNWRKIRSSCAMLNFGIILALLISGVSLLLQMPQGHDCDPHREWWQGSVVYHVLVPSFKDSDSDGIGDLQGVVSKLDYIQELGATMLRLAPVFERADYPPERLLSVQQPEFSGDVTHMRRPVEVAWNLTRVVSVLGSSSEVQLIAALLHERGLKLLLDMPLDLGIPTSDVNVPGISTPIPTSLSVSSVSVPAALSEAGRALRFWLRLGVDGFCFPDLHKLVSADNAQQIVNAIESWRLLLDQSPRRGGQKRALILPLELIRALQSAHSRPQPLLHFAPPQHRRALKETVNTTLLNATSEEDLNERRGWSLVKDDGLPDSVSLWERAMHAAHLLEERLQMDASPNAMLQQILLALAFSSTPADPWILWSMSGIGRPRLEELMRPQTRHDGASAYLVSNDKPNAVSPWRTLSSLDESSSWSSVGRNFLLVFLPGSASLYYGDEVDVSAPQDMKDLGWASIMAWSDEKFASFSDREPWLGLPDSFRWHNVASQRNSSVHALAMLNTHKQQQPPLFVNGLFDYSEDFHPNNYRNYKVRLVDDSLLILERHYPRRRKYMIVANLGLRDLQRDLSHYYYAGSVVASSHGKLGYVKFRNIDLKPGEVLACVLDK